MADPFRIDVHLHILPPFYLEAVSSAGITRSRGKAYPDWSEDLSLQLMDDNDIKTSITSISTPHVHFGDDAKARDLARRCNEFAIDMQRRRPDRFGTFAVLPLPDVESACREAIHALDDMKAEDTVTIDLTGKSTIADAMVVTSGTSNRHVTSIADKAIEALEKAGAKGLRVEGKRNGDWVLIDASDVIVHVFRPEVRAFYDIEKMWAGGRPREIGRASCRERG